MRTMKFTINRSIGPKAMYKFTKLTMKLARFLRRLINTTGAYDFLIRMLLICINIYSLVM